MKDIVALDIGGSSTKAALYSSDGSVKKTWRVRTNTDSGGRSIIADICESLAPNGVAIDNVKGIGVGVPGPVKDGVVEGAVNLGWKRIDVVRAFQETLGRSIPVFVANDANAAALGEFSVRSESIDDMMLVTLGTGVGGGIIFSGTIREGAHGASGEFGHIKVMDNGPACECGAKGCLETLASAKAIKRMAREAVNRSAPTTLKDANHLGGKQIFTHAQSGDKVAEGIIDEAARHLGKALANINATIDVPVILIGGGVANAGDFLLEKVRTHYMKNCFASTCNAKITRATLGNDAGMRGAYELVRRHG